MSTSWSTPNGRRNSRRGPMSEMVHAWCLSSIAIGNPHISLLRSFERGRTVGDETTRKIEMLELLEVEPNGEQLANTGSTKSVHAKYAKDWQSEINSPKGPKKKCVALCSLAWLEVSTKVCVRHSQSRFILGTSLIEQLRWKHGHSMSRLSRFQHKKNQLFGLACYNYNLFPNPNTAANSNPDSKCFMTNKALNT